jgi:hypothetical protein
MISLSSHVFSPADISNELPESAVAFAAGNGLRHIWLLRLITVFRQSGVDQRVCGLGGHAKSGRLRSSAALVGVLVLLAQIGLVHVRMHVFSSVGVRVGVVVLDMLVVVAGVRVRVSEFVVLVFVGVRFVVTVFVVCHCHPLYVEIPTASIVLSAMSPGNN